MNLIILSTEEIYIFIIIFYLIINHLKTNFILFY